MSKTIVYCGFGWATNIGNAFIDYGILGSLRKICPQHNVFCTSNAQTYLQHQYSTRPSRLLGSKDPADIFDLRKHLVGDYYVLAGALFDKIWLDAYGGLVDHLIERKSKVIIYGASGGNNYEDFDFVREKIKQLNLLAIATRDQPTYDHFGDLAPRSYNGIDCAFFLKEYFTPAKLDLPPFVASAFDHMKEPTIETDKDIVRLYHSAWDLGRIESLVKSPIKTATLMAKRDLISDFPDDYLNVYANCDATYSDRVHACVATLVQGGQARYYGSSSRGQLFDRIGLSSIREGLVTLDEEAIEAERQKQLDFLSDVLQ